MALNNAVILTGNANPSLAEKVSNLLVTDVGRANIGRFKDGEIRVEIDEHVRGKTAYIVQPTCEPANSNLMELLIMTDALRRSAAKRIIAVVPYYGYARQDRRPGFTRTPITSRLIADMMETAGVNQLVVVDLHSEQQQGFFHIPVINISASPEIVGDIWRTYHDEIMHESLTVVSPDVGGVVRARSIAKQLENADLAIVDKRRERANESKVMNVIGSVENRNCILIDDLIDTAGTLCSAAAALKEEGALSVAAYATHGVFSDGALGRIDKSELDGVVVTDTIPQQKEQTPKLRVLSVANLLAETIRRLESRQSVSEIYT